MLPEEKSIIKKNQFRLPRLIPPRLSLKKISHHRVNGLPHLTIGDIICNIPIVQGGMAVCISLSNLASAVSREGGIGVIAATAIGMLEPDYFKNGIQANQRALRNEIRLARAKGAKILGVNIMVAASDFSNLLQVSLEERVDIVFLGAGLPIRGIPVPALREAGVKVVPIVSSGRAARLIFNHWQKNYKDIPDGVVVEGPLAGGHLGFRVEQLDDPAFSLEKIIPQVTEEMASFEKQSGRHLPVIAAGGIFNGKDIYRFFQLGASGVQLGTRFVATHECDADQRFKESFLNSRKEDLIIIKSPVGLPGRALKSPFLQQVESGKIQNFGCPWKCLSSCNAQKAHYCISMALYHARKGNLKKGFAFAGANAYKIKNLVSVRELIFQLKNEFISSLESGINHLNREYEHTLTRFRAKKMEYRKKLQVLKMEYRKKLKQKHLNMIEDCNQIMKKIENLKRDYQECFKQVRDIAFQLDNLIKENQAIPLPIRSQF